MIPDETTINCSKCSLFNIGNQSCICDECRERLIDEWVDESDKLFEQSDIKRLKDKFASNKENDK